MNSSHWQQIVRWVLLEVFTWCCRWKELSDTLLGREDPGSGIEGKYEDRGRTL